MIYKSRQGLHLNYINASDVKYEVVIGEEGIVIGGKELSKVQFSNDDGIAIDECEFYQFVATGLKDLVSGKIILIEDVNQTIAQIMGGA